MTDTTPQIVTDMRNEANTVARILRIIETLPDRSRKRVVASVLEAIESYGTAPPANPVA